MDIFEKEPMKFELILDLNTLLQEGTDRILTYTRVISQ